MRQIREQTERVVLCYVSGQGCAIDAEDTKAFVDLLRNVPPKRPVDLLLSTDGGSVAAAENLMRMLRKRVGSAELRVIVPDCAAGAGTAMVLGADRVVLSDMSELAPIDPRAFGQVDRQPVRVHREADRERADTLAGNPGSAASQFGQGRRDLSPPDLHGVDVRRARQVAERLFRQGMLREAGIRTTVVDELLDTSPWLTHGRTISWKEARQIGLQVDYLPYLGDEWQGYWKLYCAQCLAARSQQKLFESEYVSLIVGPDGKT